MQPVTLLSAVLALSIVSTVRGESPPTGPIAAGAALEYRFDPATAAAQQDAPDEDDDSLDRYAPAERFGAKGTARLDIHGGYGFEVKDTDNTFFLAGVGYSSFIRDDFAIVLELNGLYVDQNGPNAAGLNFNLLLRYHFISEPNWSVYLDGGAGIVYFDDEVPDGASEFNFTPQLGVGFTYDIGSGNRFMAGVRWYHISNANTDPFNPGRDHAYFYAGLSLPF